MGSLGTRPGNKQRPAHRVTLFYAVASQPSLRSKPRGPVASRAKGARPWTTPPPCPAPASKQVAAWKPPNFPQSTPPTSHSQHPPPLPAISAPTSCSQRPHLPPAVSNPRTSLLQTAPPHLPPAVSAPHLLRSSLPGRPQQDRSGRRHVRLPAALGHWEPGEGCVTAAWLSRRLSDFSV